MNKPLIIFTLFGLFCSPLLSDEYHYKNILVGTKAIGLGGAFASIADDMSAVFYNPAGLAKSKLNNSASLSTFSWERSQLNDVFSNQGDFSRSSFSIVPSFLGTGKNSEKWHWSVVFAVSDLSTERNFSKVELPFVGPDGNIAGTQTEYGNIDLDNASYDLGFGTAINIAPNWSVGASLIAKYKQFETVQGSGIDAAVDTPLGILKSGFTATRRLSDENIILTPQFGLLYKGEGFSWGLKLAKDVAINRSFTGSHQIVVASPTPLPPTAKASSVGEVTGSEKQEYGTNLSTGISTKLSNLLVSFDLDYYSAVDVEEFTVAPTQPPINRDLASVTNYSLGFSYPLSDTNTIRFGVFTDNSNGIIDPEQPFQRSEVVDMVGYSVAVNTELFGFPLSIGGYYKHGTGQVRLSDIRVVERIVGLPLYPESNINDVSDMKRESFVLYLSANF
ncbi:OmpP1/FadL family transporter [Psychrosphaera haliotis]|uniref:Long-chain fatty acid transporter n=1 Tax=Psychrosphaera haliotis TaxID=555083 RepID=A0A6N8F3D3_9GAMM|nr:hypothetical protein [Psychrosphaera haliotis]MUH71166.1 hypothetical protein [Psychrosphaera haliotis]